MATDALQPVAVAVLAKAPIPGFAKTRLVPVLGEKGAAQLQARLIERAVETARAANIGPVTLWMAMSDVERDLYDIEIRAPVAHALQPEGDLGARMLAAIEAAGGPVLVIGTDSPAMTVEHLRTAADVLRAGTDVVVFPAEDGGYVLIGMREPEPALFSDISWSTAGVMDETRRRLKNLGLTWQEPAMLWDLDEPGDLERLRTIGLQELMPARS